MVLYVNRTTHHGAVCAVCTFLEHVTYVWNATVASCHIPLLAAAPGAWRAGNSSVCEVPCRPAVERHGQLAAKQILLDLVSLQPFRVRPGTSNTGTSSASQPAEPELLQGLLELLANRLLTTTLLELNLGVGDITAIIKSPMHWRQSIPDVAIYSARLHAAYKGWSTAEVVAFEP